MSSDRPHSNPEQACFALGCSFDAYIAGLGAGRDDLILLQDMRDWAIMRNAQGAYKWRSIYPDLGIEMRGHPRRLMSQLQDEFEDWARQKGLNTKRYDSTKYLDRAADWAWRAWQARDTHSIIGGSSDTVCEQQP